MTSPAADPVGAFLAEAKRLVAKRERLAKKLHSGGGGAGTVAALSAVQGKLAELSPVLLAALEAVLAAHRPGGNGLLCADCADVWPCTDYRRIESALRPGDFEESHAPVKAGETQ